MRPPHRVFSEFAPYEGWAEAGFERGFYGVNIRDWLYLGHSKGYTERRAVHVGHPPLDEEYFEWIALLTTISRARGRFCMAELGAGLGAMDGVRRDAVPAEGHSVLPDWRRGRAVAL